MGCGILAAGEELGSFLLAFGRVRENTQMTFSRNASLPLQKAQGRVGRQELTEGWMQPGSLLLRVKPGEAADQFLQRLLDSHPQLAAERRDDCPVTGGAAHTLPI